MRGHHSDLNIRQTEPGLDQLLDGRPGARLDLLPPGHVPGGTGQEDGPGYLRHYCGESSVLHSHWSRSNHALLSLVELVCTPSMYSLMP